nr:MFS transporter [Tumebacillus sp. BK434]
MIVIKSALLHRNFRFLFLGQSGTAIGMNLFAFALYWFVQDSTNDPQYLLWLGLMMSIPQLISVFGGVIADRGDRLKVMIRFESIRFLLVLILAIYVGVKGGNFWVIASLYLLMNVIGNLSSPASQALVPEILPESDWASGNGLIQGVRRFAGVIAASTCAVLLSFVPVSVIFGFYSFLILLSLLTLFAILRNRAADDSSASTDPHDGSTNEQLSWWNSLVQGFRFTWELKILRLLIPIFILENVLYIPYMILAAAWSDVVLHAGARGYSLLELSIGAGAVAGYILSSWVSKKISLEQGFVLFSGLQIVIVLYPAITNLYVNMLLLFVMGLGSAVAGNFFFTILQKIVPSKLHGRVIGMLTTVVGGILPLGTVISGGFLHLFGLHGAYWIASVGLAVTAIVQMIAVYQYSKTNTTHSSSLQG